MQMETVLTVNPSMESNNHQNQKNSRSNHSASVEVHEIIMVDGDEENKIKHQNSTHDKVRNNICCKFMSLTWTKLVKCFSVGASIDERYGRKFSVGERVADAVSLAVGSWKFVLIQSSLLITWLILNVILARSTSAWDPYPFILLNLMLSFQAAYTAPIIMMSQNRGADVDRLKAEDLHEKVDHIRLNQMFTLCEAIQAQTKQIDRLETKLEQLSNIILDRVPQKPDHVPAERILPPILDPDEPVGMESGKHSLRLEEGD